MIASLALALVVAAGPPPKNPRVSCGCPTSRILERGPAILDDTHGVSAWLHDDSQLELFQQDAVEKQKLTAVEGAPVDIAPFAVPGAPPGASTSSFVRARAVGALPERAYLGVMRKTDRAPRDVVAVHGEGEGAPAAVQAGAPVVTALWLAPLEERERIGCGEWLTHRIAFELAPGSPAPEAFLVEDAHTKRTALVDARFAGVFGLGRVDVCDQGLSFAAGSPTHITVRPVSASFDVGDAWKYDSDGTGQTDLVRTASPPSADRARIDDPFPVPGMDDHRGPSLKLAAVAVMSVVVGGAAVFALFAWVIIPMRRRRMADIRCPACGTQIPYDTLDPKTDGFFCPKCGAAGFWKGKKGVDASANAL